jgi:hypothetical protein
MHSVIRDSSSLSSAQIRAKLENFTINFDGQNSPSEVILADGTKAEFSGSEAVIRAANGQVIETVSLSSREQFESFSASGKSTATIIAQGGSGCEGNIRDQIYSSGQSAGSKSDALKDAQSDEGKTFSWALTFGKRALEDSLVAGTRNQTLQEVACKPPVQCNQPQTYEGGSEIRTDLFQLSSGTNQEVNLEYEFYSIPDRIELYYEGNIVFSVGPASGSATEIIDDIPDGAAYVGVKLIGNENTSTKWWYTISCSGEPDGPLGIDRWWATAGDASFPVTWTLDVRQEGNYSLNIMTEGGEWSLTPNATSASQSCKTGMHS